MNDCKDCKFKFGDMNKEPCASCDNGSNYKERIKKESLKELRESVKQAIHSFPLAVNPCELCKHKDRFKTENLEVCKVCCYYYPSRFELE